MAPSSTSNAGVVAPAVPRTRLLNSLGLIAAAAILIFGAWVSLRYTFGAFAPDADIAVPVVLWDGVRHYGLGFLKTWSYTQDNWLLSLIPLTSLIFTLFGTNPKLVVAIGWLFFLACVGMTSFLVYRIAGRRAAFPVAAVLLFPNNWAIGSVGFLSYPISHDVSMAWALLALMLALRAIERASLLSVAAAGLCVFVDAMSDPWAGAAIALPLILASAVLAGLNWRVRQGWYAGALCAAAAIAFLAARTRLFGALDFLPPSHFTITNASGLVNNIGWMFRATAIMFNIVPHTSVGSPLSIPLCVFDFLALAAVLIGAAVLAVMGLRRSPIAEQLVCLVAILSLAGVVVAFLLNEWGGEGWGTYMGRYFPNLYFFGALLAGTAAVRNWERLHFAVRAALVTYGLLFIASGLVSYPRQWAMWTGQAPFPTSSYITDLGAFLVQNGLTYGYGPYWGSDALAMNWLTGGRVTIRPVAFLDKPDRVGIRGKSSILWYAPGDEPAGTPETFLVINDDGENCPSVESCVATASRQFGAPSRRLAYANSVMGNFAVLVWSHPIVSQIAAR